MKKIRELKNATIRQILNMVENLEEKFKVFSSIQIEARGYPREGEEGDKELSYYVYVENNFHKEFSEWKEVILAYNKLMKRESHV